MKCDNIRQPSPRHRIFRSSFCPCDPRSLVCKKVRTTESNGQTRVDKPVFVELDANDDNLGGVDTDRHSCTIGLVTLYSVDVDNPFLAVNLRDLSFPTLVFPAHNSNLIIFTDR